MFAYFCEVGFSIFHKISRINFKLRVKIQLKERELRDDIFFIFIFTTYGFYMNHFDLFSSALR